MYLPKLYTILFKPEENTTEKFREKMRAQTFSDTSSLTTGNVCTTRNNRPVLESMTPPTSISSFTEKA